MRDIIDAVSQWARDGRDRIAVATVVRTWGSAPRKAGAKFAFTPQHDLAGSVSGGCIESAVFEAGMAVLESGRGRLLEFGVADELAFDTIGLACGGSVSVWIEPLSRDVLTHWQAANDNDLGWARAVVIEPGTVNGESSHVVEATPSTHGAGELSRMAQDALRRAQSPGIGTLQDGRNVFIDVELAPPKLICIGAVHIAQALVPMAKLLGYHTVVVDAREAFATRDRMPLADELILEWPDTALNGMTLHGNTAVVTLTHDEKFDDPALMAALRSAAFYVGALGGKNTRQKRRERLMRAGLTATELDRLHAPIGLDLGSQTPEEIALAALAQITQARHAKHASDLTAAPK